MFGECLTSNSARKYINGRKCAKLSSFPNRFSTDMLWIFRASGRGQKKLLINVKTLKCIEHENVGKKFIMEQCQKKFGQQEIVCKKWLHWQTIKLRWKKRFFHLPSSGDDVVSMNTTELSAQFWENRRNSCIANTAYEGMLHTLFIHYLSQVNIRQFPLLEGNVKET